MRISTKFFQLFSRMLPKIGILIVPYTLFSRRAATNMMDLLTFLGERVVQVFTQKKAVACMKFFLSKYAHLYRVFSTFFVYKKKKNSFLHKSVFLVFSESTSDSRSKKMVTKSLYHARYANPFFLEFISCY